MLKSYKYRIYPNKEQRSKINNAIEICRTLYNVALDQRISIYKQDRKSISCYEQINQLSEMKETYNEFQSVYSQTAQDVLRRLDKSFKAFFGRVKKHQKAGFPRFKSKDFYNSICYPQKGFKIENKKVFLSKIGLIKVKMHREIIGKIKTCSIVREDTKFFVCFSSETKDNDEQRVISSAIGIDLGLSSFATLSDGTKVDNPRYFRKTELELAKQQRRLSKKVKESKNRFKQKERVVKIHYKIKNQRKDFLHKLSRMLVNKYDLIVYEDLSIKNMLKNKRFAKSISDASWSLFCQMLRYKAAEIGKYALPVCSRRTSQICSSCGEVVEKSLFMRVHKCPICHLELDRDENAALNILKLGINKYRRDYGNSRLGNLFDRTDEEPRSTPRLRGM